MTNVSSNVQMRLYEQLFTNFRKSPSSRSSSIIASRLARNHSLAGATGEETEVARSSGAHPRCGVARGSREISRKRCMSSLKEDLRWYDEMCAGGDNGRRYCEIKGVAIRFNGSKRRDAPGLPPWPRRLDVKLTAKRRVVSSDERKPRLTRREKKDRGRCSKIWRENCRFLLSPRERKRLRAARPPRSCDR